MTLGSSSVWITGCYKVLPQSIAPAPAGVAGALPPALLSQSIFQKEMFHDICVKWLKIVANYLEAFLTLWAPHVLTITSIVWFQTTYENT